MVISNVLLVVWQVLHTGLILAVLAVLWILHRRLSELRAARNEAQAWLNEFAKLINLASGSAKDIKHSVKVAQDHLPDLRRLIASAERAIVVLENIIGETERLAAAVPVGLAPTQVSDLSTPAGREPSPSVELELAEGLAERKVGDPQGLLRRLR